MLKLFILGSKALALIDTIEHDGVVADVEAMWLAIEREDEAAIVVAAKQTLADVESATSDPAVIAAVTAFVAAAEATI
jgi:hypothetical protein